MNRHQRRAAQNQKPGTSDDAGAVAPFGALEGIAPQPAKTAPGAPRAEKPSFTMRLLAKILLSNWVLSRVSHPDVERLLISFANQAGRPEVADSLVRRQAFRT